MAVASRGAALSALRLLINHDQVEARTLLKRPYLPADLELSTDPVRMTPDTLVGGYGNESRYVLGGGDPDTWLAIAQTPRVAFSDMTADTVEPYAKASLDLTMEGGTTSGVVYPLAVCELATTFRFRNVGGASAGAIAAAMTAAAELGRSSEVLAGVGPSTESVLSPSTGSGNEAAASGNEEAGPGNEEAGSGNEEAGSGNGPSKNGVRRGFVGLTDVIAWLTQIQPGDPEGDEYRLGQLFRAGRSTQRIFRLITAVMRGRGWSLPLVALFAFGRVTRAIAIAFLVLDVVVTGWVAKIFAHDDRGWPSMIGWGLLGALSFVATLAAGVLAVQGIQAVAASRTPATGPPRLQQLRNFSSAYGSRPLRAGRPLVIGAVLIVAVIIFFIVRPRLYAAAVLVGLAAALIIAVVLARAVVAYLGRLQSHAYGLVPGTTPHRSRSLLDVIAGTPKPTVDESLVPWLTHCLNALAGLGHDQVLRFGHLWAGPAFEQQRLAPTPDDLVQWQSMAVTSDECLVNLQLMTTDLTRQRPFRFPLPPWILDDPDQLWLCVDQLRDGESQMFTEEVMQALSATESREIHDHLGQRRTLHQLPQPWDLPVVFAVRISMALPALFQGVRMYRIPTRLPAQDDFGRTLLDHGKPLVLDDARDTPQELWFSDGGITSNFPVHFFDNPLPRWPTVSLNLGTHPDDAPHTDIWLPQDWEELTAPRAAIAAGGLSFAGAIFDTAMGWRDSMQSALPGYRNRTAQVRTGQGEGGNNLFMSREIVASMALRGVLAGARLRTRFADQSHWDRFRWLRLRTALSNLEAARISVQERRSFYADALAGPDWLTARQAAFVDRTLGQPVPWYGPQPPYWPKAARLLNTFADAYRPKEDPVDVMVDASPKPQPILRQVPKE